MENDYSEEYEATLAAIYNARTPDEIVIAQIAAHNWLVAHPDDDREMTIRMVLEQLARMMPDD